ncbi:LysR family transcriptional regulator [Rhizobium sp. CC-YZS058]|uniref:LysR family transcriptional regulator n=1 Tax=Rhizobium sp. CC-YZS058 TaxID=3042153 RepID=UPI002B057BFB|nr:LysR family transcriptional regulator [Rhizobium sp. CC-YZS058]MEA3537001.1 LysR family transcriptional regulator [Rhizobium sp. CC-YZS058]
MNLLDSMNLYLRIVERASFTAAANDLGVPRATATNAIKALERRLGVRLLQRTTRHVALTSEGEAYAQRCRALLADLESMEDEFATVSVKGHLRVDIHGNLFRQFLLPHLMGFTTDHPQLTLHVGDGDRLVDLVREGVDCVVRAGEPVESGMIVRRLALLDEITVASPQYLAKHGTPMCIPDLHTQSHRMIGFASSRTGTVLPLEFVEPQGVRLVTISSPVTVNSSDTSAALARMGFGLTQAPRFRFEQDLASGVLVEVLPNCPPTPTPVSVLYPSQRYVPRRLRVFIDWLALVFSQMKVVGEIAETPSSQGKSKAVGHQMVPAAGSPEVVSPRPTGLDASRPRGASGSAGSESISRHRRRST